MNFYLFDKHRLREERTTTTTVAASVEAELLSSRERRTTTTDGGFTHCHLGLFFLREILMLSPSTHKKSAPSSHYCQLSNHTRELLAGTSTTTIHANVWHSSPSFATT